jgi:response regulator RpfG family c-di-GMP phosphodiesterase
VVVEEELAQLAEDRSAGTVRRAVAAARELLDMDLAFVGRFTEGHQVFDAVSGNPASFGVQQGGSVPLPETYCQRMLDGELPEIIGDAQAHPVAGALPITQAAGIGSFVSVPMTFSDGRLFGTLCAVSHDPRSDLGERDVRFLRVLARLIIETLEREEAERERRRLETEAAAGQALLAAIAARDRATAEHSRDMVDLAESVAAELGIEEPERLSEIMQVALLHDIGKLAIPDRILAKPGPLDPGEWELMREHPALGANLVESIGDLAALGPSIRAAHERWDGGGYPRGLRGEQIPLAARITFVCDAYHAMISNRPYRAAIGEARARAELRRNAGEQFCPTCADALLSALERRNGQSGTLSTAS